MKEKAWPWLTEEQRAIGTSYLTLIEAITEQVREVEGRIERSAREDAGAQLLQTIPGIGPYRSLLLVAEIQPISRFPSQVSRDTQCRTRVSPRGHGALEGSLGTDGSRREGDTSWQEKVEALRALALQVGESHEIEDHARAERAFQEATDHGGEG